MTPTKRKILAVLGMLGLLIFAGFMARELVAANEVVLGIAEGILIPAAALWELCRAWSKGPDTADVAVRMLPIVALALACAVLS